MTPSEISQPYGPERRRPAFKWVWPAAGNPLPELVVPNPKLKLMDEVREVLRVERWRVSEERTFTRLTLERFLTLQRFNFPSQASAATNEVSTQTNRRTRWD